MNNTSTSKCSHCGVDSDEKLIFHVQGQIMAHKGTTFGGIVGGNIALGPNPENWEKSRDRLVAQSDDNTLRVYSMTYCQTCLLDILTVTR